MTKCWNHEFRKRPRFHQILNRLTIAKNEQFTPLPPVNSTYPHSSLFLSDPLLNDSGNSSSSEEGKSIDSPSPINKESKLSKQLYSEEVEEKAEILVEEKSRSTAESQSKPLIFAKTDSNMSTSAPQSVSVNSFVCLFPLIPILTYSVIVWKFQIPFRQFGFGFWFGFFLFCCSSPNYPFKFMT